jgi:hypothetical protein
MDLYPYRLSRYGWIGMEDDGGRVDELGCGHFAVSGRACEALRVLSFERFQGLRTVWVDTTDVLESESSSCVRTSALTLVGASVRAFALRMACTGVRTSVWGSPGLVGLILFRTSALSLVVGRCCSKKLSGALELYR